jgi:hypothetical protein
MRSDSMSYYAQLVTEASIQVRNDPECMRLFSMHKKWLHRINWIAPFDQFVLWRLDVWRERYMSRKQEVIWSYVKSHSHTPIERSES